MGAFSIWHWLILIIVAAAFLVPVGRILHRAGFSPFLAILALIPLINLLSLWAFAFIPWPTHRDPTQ